MKKRLFSSFMSLLLCGAMLATTGCKDYDDDINALRNDVEDLKGAVVKLNELEGRIEAVEETKEAFDAIDLSDFALKNHI